jgi:hypothetical protein
MLFVQSGDSAKASSALQALDTRMPDHDPGFVALFCAATGKVAMKNSARKRRKQGFAVKPVLTDIFNSGTSFHS